MKTEQDACAVERCLQQVESLRAELGNTTKAIMDNAITVFEQSIARQQELLGTLADTLPSVVAFAAASNREDRGKNTAIFRLNQSLRDLRKVSAPYSVLLGLSSRCARQMQSLYRTASPIADSSELRPGYAGESWSLNA